MVKEAKRKGLHARAEMAAEERMLDALVGATASAATREACRKKLRAGELDDKEVEIELTSAGGGGLPMFEMPNMPGTSIGAINIGDIFGKGLGKAAKPRRLLVREAHAPLLADPQLP